MIQTILRMTCLAWLLAILISPAEVHQHVLRWGTAFHGVPRTMLIEGTPRACWEFVYQAATRTWVLAEPEGCDEEAP